MEEVESETVKAVIMLPDLLNRRLEEAQRAAFLTNRADFLRLLLDEALSKRGF